MPEPKEAALPENSTELLRQLAPVLEEFLDFDRFVIGGASVLAARWQHRRSFGVGLFTVNSEGTMAIHQLGGQLRVLARVRYGDSVSVSTTPRHGEIVMGSRGIVEWAFVQRLTQRPPMLEVEPLTRMQLDCTEEILAQKLYSRMFVHSGRAIREIYDLAWAIERYWAECLAPAISCFGSDNGRAMLAVLREMRDGFLAIDCSRPIVDPADPDLEKRAISVLHAHLKAIWPRSSRESQAGMEQ